jgi:hypothetical protein
MLKPVEDEGRPPSPARRRSRDQEWCLSDPGVRHQYAGQVVAVYDRKVWGSGGDVAAALAAAQGQPGCPAPADLVLALLPDEEQASFPLLRIPPNAVSHSNG